MANKDWFIAIPDGVHEERSHTDLKMAVWDMLRYDRCFPESNQPHGWLVFRQPEEKGIQGGFTKKRWASFGVHKAIIERGDGAPGIPYRMFERIRKNQLEDMA